MGRFVKIPAWSINLAVVILCLLCASNATAQGGVFDHAETGFDLVGGHSVLPCDSCHVNGQFEGTPRECFSCHSMNGIYNATQKPPDHIYATEQCDACHQTTLWQDMRRVDHDHVLGDCQSCHNNVRVEGKPPNHIPVVIDQCDACHNPVSVFALFHMDHDFVSDDCISCHYKNSPYTGQFDGHPETGNVQCSVCHNSRTTFAFP